MLYATRVNRYESRTNYRIKLVEWKHKYGEMGSKGNNYIVTRTHNNGNESFECSCPATMYRPWLQACKHIKRLKEKLMLP